MSLPPGPKRTYIRQDFFLAAWTIQKDLVMLVCTNTPH